VTGVSAFFQVFMGLATSVTGVTTTITFNASLTGTAQSQMDVYKTNIASPSWTAEAGFISTGPATPMLTSASATALHSNDFYWAIGSTANATLGLTSNAQGFLTYNSTFGTIYGDVPGTGLVPASGWAIAGADTDWGVGTVVFNPKIVLPPSGPIPQLISPYQGMF
jgi:hypothetical protein